MQGITEFLPVSSTAHLLIGERLLGFTDPGSVFTEMIQLGSIVAIVWLYRRKVVEVVTGIPTRPEARRVALSRRASELGLPIIEDNPYGDLWFDQAPPLPLSARNPDACVYLGSFSKVLAPGLRLGFLVAPKPLYPKLLQAKQAADLHSPSFNQRMIVEVMKDGFLDRHVPTIRALYKSQRDAMLAALQREMAGLDVQWNTPAGGMFIWMQLPREVSAIELLPRAVDKGVAFVPGAAFFADGADQRTVRLSFVTASTQEIDTGMAALAAAIRETAALTAGIRAKPALAAGVRETPALTGSK